MLIIILVMFFMHVLLTFVLFRGGKERLVRREILVHLELRDHPASAGLPEMTVPRVTLYVSSTDRHTKPSWLMLFD